jgi:hypothetical protein
VALQDMNNLKRAGGYDATVSLLKDKVVFFAKVCKFLSVIS